jgi:hypothetical protein
MSQQILGRLSTERQFCTEAVTQMLRLINCWTICFHRKQSADQKTKKEMHIIVRIILGTMNGIGK